MILYRPVGLQELELIYDSGMKAFPARLPQQPIFYPVLQLEYARQTASDWNAKSGQSAGYVTQFKVEDQYINKFQKHTIGGSQHEEFWIPTEEMEEFNRHIIGHIKVLEAYFGDAFQGFIPETFGMQGKNAVAQFTLLANSYLYNRMDFYLEIKRNHKAIFLNFPFWQKHEFKNPGLKEKIVKAIKDAWLTSFPKIPLANPVPEDVTPVKQIDSDRPAQHQVAPVQEDITPVKKTDAPSHAPTGHLVNPVHENTMPTKQRDSRSSVDPVYEDISPVRSTDSYSLVNPVDEESTFVEETDTDSLLSPVEEDSALEEQIDSSPPVNPAHEEMAREKPTDAHAQHFVHPVYEDAAPAKRTTSHFSRGLALGLSGKVHEAIEELSRAVEEDPDHVVAHTSLGVAFHRLGEDDRALACYDAALKMDPTCAEAHYFRANIVYSQGNVREAIAGYTIAVGLEPELIQAHERPAPEDRLTEYGPAPAGMYRIARPARRILELNRALETNPRQANLFKERAAEYSRLWNYEQAIADYSSSLAIQPDDASSLYLRGLAYEQTQQLDRALEDFQKAIAINPQLSEVYINRGVTFGKMGNFRQSIASLTEAIRLAPQNPDAYFNRGTSYFQLGDLESAIHDFSNVLRLSPSDEAAYYWRGISNEEAGRPRQAIADYRQFLALSRDENARTEIEGRLSQWNEGDRNGVRDQSVVSNDRQETNPVGSEKPDPQPDLHDLIAALGERALPSTWFGSGVNCYGESAEELYALTAQNRSVEGGDFLRIASGIRQTVEGDFQAFDPGATSPWIFIRAWDGSGFYIETDDPQIVKRLKTHFPALEQVEGASPPYVGLFIRIYRLSH